MSEPLALSLDQRRFVSRMVRTGRFASSGAVIGAALALLEQQEDARLAQLEAVHAALADVAEAIGASNNADPLAEIERLMTAELMREEPLRKAG